MPGIKIGSAPVKRVVLGDGAGGKTLKRVVLGDGSAGTVLWQNKPVVVINNASNPDVQLRKAVAAYGLDYRTVTELPFDLDTSAATSLNDMFSSCRGLKTIPPMDTRNVTSFSGTFQKCSALTTIPPMDTSKATSMSSMFGECTSLVFVPVLDAGLVTNVYDMFNSCAKLTDGNVRLIRRDGTKPGTRTGMVTRSGLTRDPFFWPDGTPIN